MERRKCDITNRGFATNFLSTFVRMIHVSILILRNAVPGSITDSVDIFDKVNEFIKEKGQEPLFNIQLVGFTAEVKYNSGKYSIRPDVLFESVKKTDLIIIPSFTGHMSSTTYLNKDCAMWIADHYKSGAEVVDEKVITDQDGIYSSGGSNAYWNLLIHLVEKYTNREMAIRTAKYFVIDLDKNNQSPFIIFQGLKDHEDEMILKAQNFIEQNYSEKITVEQISDTLYLTRRTFERRFKKATRHTVAEYIQRVKIEATKKQLEIGRKTINEIMYEVGYSDIQAFRELFKRITGKTPNEYRSKYKPAM